MRGLLVRWLGRWLGRDARLDRWIERELCEGLPPRQRARLHERLRRDPRARARYDRAVAALRVFEGDGPLASVELDVVGRWLADDHQPAPAPVPARRWGSALVAAVAAAVLLLWVRPLVDGDAGSGTERPWIDDHDGWQARGGGDATLALEVLCGPTGTPDPALRVRDCRHPDLMGFAYRVAAGTEGTLVLFGIDAQGDPMFYQPTPVDPAGVAVAPGRWRALPLAVRLTVNHAPGPLRIYGLVAPRVATVDEIRAWVARLAPQAAADPGDPPWIERVDPSSIARVCPTPADCHAAELALTLQP